MDLWAHRKRVVFWVAAAACLSIFLSLFLSDRNLFELYTTHKMVKRRQSDVEAAREAVDSLDAEMERLRNDTAYLEQLAREKLGMARRNEKVYKFVEEKR